MAGAVMFARAAIPRMVTLSTPTSPTMDLAAFRIRNRVRSLMLRSLHWDPDKALRPEGEQERPDPLADRFGEQRSLPRRAPVNKVHRAHPNPRRRRGVLNDVHRSR